jgi:hypothetical protein
MNICNWCAVVGINKLIYACSNFVYYIMEFTLTSVT